MLKECWTQRRYLTITTRPTEFNNSLPELLCSDDDSGNEDVLDMEYTEAEAESLKRNAEVLHIHTMSVLGDFKQVESKRSEKANMKKTLPGNIHSLGSAETGFTVRHSLYVFVH